MNTVRISTNNLVQIDYEELANLAGITKASARTMYPKAKKKLAAFHAAAGPAATAADTTGAAPDTPVQVKKSAASRRCKKPKAVNQTAADMDLPDVPHDFDDAESGEPMNSAVEETEDAEATDPVIENDEI